MSEQLAARVRDLINIGWVLKSQTETTAALQIRRPFNWQFFALMLVLFPGFGGLLYAAFWSLTPHAQLFLSVEGGAVVTAGGTRLLESQQGDLDLAKRLQGDLQERGFWETVGPSILAMGLVVAVWFSAVWLFVRVAF